MGPSRGSLFTSERRSLTALIYTAASDTFSPTVFDNPSSKKVLKNVFKAVTTSFLMQNILFRKKLQVRYSPLLEWVDPIEILIHLLLQLSFYRIGEDILHPISARHILL